MYVIKINPGMCEIIGFKLFFFPFQSGNSLFKWNLTKNKTTILMKYKAKKNKAKLVWLKMAVVVAASS